MNKNNATLHIVYLRFGTHRDRATEFMDEHVDWIRGGIDEGAFLCAGSLQDHQGGVVIAFGLEEEALDRRLAEDPFVAHGVVAVEKVPVSVGLMQDALRASWSPRTT